MAKNSEEKTNVMRLLSQKKIENKKRGESLPLAPARELPPFF